MWRASIGFAPKKKEAPAEEMWADNGQPYFPEVPNDTPEPIVEDKPDYTTVFNFFRNLRPIIEQFAPDKCFFVLEGHAQFRYDIFGDYKANRKIIKTAAKQAELDRFYEQKNIIVDVLRHFPITIARAADYECDDTIATLAHSLPDEDVTVLSNDTDFIQLLQSDHKNIKVYNPISKKFYQPPTYHYVAWKCLCGDASDNIPGFPGIGDKKAQKLLADPDRFQEFMSVEENRANFNIFKSLIEFRSVPMEEIILQEGGSDWPEIKNRFNQMEFNSITKDKTWERYVETFSCIRY